MSDSIMLNSAICNFKYMYIDIKNNSIYQLKSKTSVLNCLLNNCYSKVEKRGNLTLTFNDNCTHDAMNMIRLGHTKVIFAHKR